MAEKIDDLEKQLAEMREQFGDVQNQLKSFASEKWDDAEDAFEEGRQKAGKLLRRGRKQAREAWEDTKDTASDWASNVESCVRNHPWSVAAVIGGIAVAAAIIYRVAESDSERRFFSRWR